MIIAHKITSTSAFRYNNRTLGLQQGGTNDSADFDQNHQTYGYGNEDCAGFEHTYFPKILMEP